MGILAHDEWKMGDDDWAALRVHAVAGQGSLRWRSASNLATRASTPSGRPRAAASEKRQPAGARSSPP